MQYTVFGVIEGGEDLIVAGVIEGQHACVDTDEVGINHTYPTLTCDVVQKMI
jgi:hypothetical protein